MELVQQQRKILEGPGGIEKLQGHTILDAELMMIMKRRLRKTPRNSAIRYIKGHTREMPMRSESECLRWVTDEGYPLTSPSVIACAIYRLKNLLKLTKQKTVSMFEKRMKRFEYEMNEVDTVGNDTGPVARFHGVETTQDSIKHSHLNMISILRKLSYVATECGVLPAVQSLRFSMLSLSQQLLHIPPSLLLVPSDDPQDVTFSTVMDMLSGRHHMQCTCLSVLDIFACFAANLGTIWTP